MELLVPLDLLAPVDHLETEACLVCLDPLDLLDPEALLVLKGREEMLDPLGKKVLQDPTDPRGHLDPLVPEVRGERRAHLANKELLA